MKRKPYKGGRNKRLSAIRVTEEEKKMIDKKKEKYKMTYSDLIVNAVRKYETV